MEFRIAHYDTKNWTLEELRPGGIDPETKEVKPDKWAIVGYFGQLEHIAVALLNRQIATPGGTLETQVKELLTELKAAEKRIADQLTATNPAHKQ